MEGFVEKGDSVMDTDPKLAYNYYDEAIKVYRDHALDTAKKECKDGEFDPESVVRDNPYQSIETRRARGFLMANKGDSVALSNDDYLDEFSKTLHDARISKSRYWGELVCIMGIICHCKSSITYAEGMYRKAIEIFEDEEYFGKIPTSWRDVILAETYQSYKVLAISMLQDSVATKLDKKTDNLYLRNSKNLSNYLPHPYLPIPVEKELDEENFLKPTMQIIK